MILFAPALALHEPLLFKRTVRQVETVLINCYLSIYDSMQLFLSCLSRFG
jgi:hypothetical protein